MLGRVQLSISRLLLVMNADGANRKGLQSPFSCPSRSVATPSPSPSDDLSSRRKRGKREGLARGGARATGGKGGGGLSCRSNLPEIDSIIHQWQCPKRWAFSREAELGLETVATWGFNPPKLDRPTGVAFNGEYAKRN